MKNDDGKRLPEVEKDNMVEYAPKPKRLKSESMTDEHEPEGPEVNERIEMGAKSSLMKGTKESNPLGKKANGRLGEKLKPFKAIWVGFPGGIKKEKSRKAEICQIRFFIYHNPFLGL